MSEYHTAHRENQVTSDTVATDLLDVILFIPFVIVFLGVLLIFEPLQWISLRLGRRAHEKCIVMLNFCLLQSLKITGMRLEVSGETPNCALQQPLIIISNHQSLFDIPILHTIFAKHYPRFIAKQELGRFIPSVSFNLKYGENALIDRSNARQAIQEIKKLGERMREKKFAAVIFPEGTRAKNGVLKDFKPLGVSSLIDSVSEAKVIPVSIDGSWKLALNKLGPIPRGIKVKVHISPPLERGDLSSKQLVEEAHTKVREGLNSLRHKAG